jgi:hypothetical protein
MIAARSASLNPVQPATSARVRWQPRHRPLSPSTMQTFTQGLAIGGFIVLEMHRRRSGGKAVDLGYSNGNKYLQCTQ